MRFLTLIFMLFLSTGLAVAAESPAVPTTTITPAPAEKVDMAKVNKAAAAASALNTAEKRKLLSALQRQLPKKSAAEKAEDRQMTIARWQSLSAEDKAARREKAAAKWVSLSETEKQYQRDQLGERLRALPAADRALVIAPFSVPSNSTSTPAVTGVKP